MRSTRWISGIGGAVLATVTAAASTVAIAATPATTKYAHIFVIVEENHGFTDVIGNPAAPNLNALARDYGIATQYYGVTHPSEPNYVALLGGGTFGVANDNPYYLNRVDRPSLISQLDRAGVGWRAYLQSTPHAGYQGICYPSFCNGTPDKDPLYVSKHNPVVNFTTSWNTRDWSRQVPATQLQPDLRRGHVPALSLVIPDECRDQHGDPPYCVDSGTPGDPQDQHLVATGDAYLGQTVSAITHAPLWSRGNNAVVVVYDEGDDSAGPNGGTTGGGRVAAVVITSHGPRHATDATPYNHYSLLKTVQRNFGLGCLAATCHSDVAAMTPLFAPTGAVATSTQVQQPPRFDTPTPTPTEPVTLTTNHDSRAGWTVQPAPQRGTGDNSFGAVAATSPDNVWAVGNYLPDAANSNPDATLTLAAHWDGHGWQSTPTPNQGPNFNTLFGVTSYRGQAWAVGDSLDSSYEARSLIEHWDGSRWHLAAGPPVAGRNMLFAVSHAGRHDVWAVGQRETSTGTFSALIEHYDGHAWRVSPAAPLRAPTSLYGVTAVTPEDVYAVGQVNRAGNDSPLVEHYDGRHWRVLPVRGAPNGLLDAVTVHRGVVWAAGQTDDARHSAQPLIVSGSQSLRAQTLGKARQFSNLNGIAIDRVGHVWATGTVFDPHGTYDGSPGGVQQTLVLERTRTGWHPVAAPSPGTADRVLGGVINTSDGLITVGYFKQPQGRSPLVETHP